MKRADIIKLLPKKCKYFPNSKWSQGMKYGINQYRKEVIKILKKNVK